MASLVERLRSSLSVSRPKSGRVVTVYDGRSWPVVKCGAVYVTDDEKTKSVTKSVISQAANVDGKKPKSSKYSLAVGSSFGHVHSFLKESDPVLKSLDNSNVEDKCLLLIRKPKSASKQALKNRPATPVSIDEMLKAHSWANLASSDMHLRQPDGSLSTTATTTNTDPYHQFKSKNKRSPRSSDQTNSNPANRKSPFRGPVNPSSSVKELSSVIEQEEDVRAGQQLTWQHQNDNAPVERKSLASLSHSLSSHSSKNSFNAEKSKSNIDLRQIDKENNNNKNHPSKMGSGWSVLRPKAPPPAVPEKKTLSKYDNSQQHHSSSLPPDERNNNVTSKLSLSLHVPQTNPVSTRDNSWMSHSVYNNGFKQELHTQSEKGHRVTSSPRNVLTISTKSSTNSTHQGHESGNKPRPEPQYYPKGREIDRNSYNQANGQTVRKDTRSYSNPPVVNETVRREHRSVEDARRDYSRDNHNHKKQVNGNVPPAKPSRSKQYTQHQSDGDNRQVLTDDPQNAAHRNDSLTKRKSMGDLTNDKPLTVDKDDSVYRAQSMNDLSAGYTFSLVGQKKADSYLDMSSEEFTGSKLTQHFRKYREIKKDSKHGSLPFRGKAIDENSTYMPQNIEQLVVSSTDTTRPSHYSSLQHLPVSTANDHRQVVPTRNHAPTPAKPRRSLPQVPAADVHEKKKQYTEVVRQKINNSCSRSNSSRSSSTSNRGSSIMEQRVNGVCQTPSDREVSALLNSSNVTESHWPGNGSGQQECNNHNHSNHSNYSIQSQNGHTLLPDALYEVPVTHNQSSSFHAAPSGGRLSESGQTTLTSQSTIDSGYITNDPDQESYSTSNYAKSLKESAQSMYASNQLFKSPKGDNSVSLPNQSSKGGNSHTTPKVSKSMKHARDAHTKSWIDNYPHHMSDSMKMSIIETPYRNKASDNTKQYSNDKTDRNNNKNSGHVHERPQAAVTRQNSENNNKYPNDFQPVKHSFSHNQAEVSQRHVDKLQPNGHLKVKGKSLSMSQGLNLIEASPLSKSQPKFTGSLKDLLGNDKEIVAIETQKVATQLSSNTLPSNHRFSSGNLRLESSLKCLGKPSLFQLLQNYNLYGVRVKLMDNFDIFENLRLIECEVVLPPVWVTGPESSPTVTSPKGSYARLGGPNSAFRPVTGGNQVKTVSMVTVMEISNQLMSSVQTGTLYKGDLIVEINECLMVGETLETLGSLLQSCHGELLLTVARDKARKQQSTEQTDLSTVDEDLRLKDEKIVELTSELRRKDRTLRQLTALLPWKQMNGRGKNSEIVDHEDMCNLSEDEFIV